MEKEQLQPFIGKRVIVRLKTNPTLFGVLGEAVYGLPGQFEVVTSKPEGGNTHTAFSSYDVASIKDSTPEEEQALVDACTCAGSTDPMAWTSCAVHRMNAPPLT
jgi:hypothetical protein